MQISCAQLQAYHRVWGLIMCWQRSRCEGFETIGLEQKAWIRLGELIASDGGCTFFISSHSFIIIFREWAQLRQRHVSTRIVTCAHTSWFGTSPSTLVQCQSQRSLAQSWHGWSKELVLLTLEKAAARLAGNQHSAESVKNTYRIAC